MIKCYHLLTSAVSKAIRLSRALGNRKSIRETGSRMRKGSYSEREGMRSRMSRLRDRATELEIQINTDLFDSARVIASTLVSSNHRLLNGRRFPTLFIDEAPKHSKQPAGLPFAKATE